MKVTRAILIHYAHISLISTVTSSKMVKQTCPHCLEILPTHMDLRLHVLKFHPAKINEIPPLTCNQKNWECKKCSMSFRSDESLQNHIREAHPPKDEETKVTISSSVQKKAPRSENKKCPLCDFQCSWINTYKKHMKKNHPKEAPALTPAPRIQKKDKKCPLCSFCNTSKNEINDHFTKDHNIRLQTKSFNFANLSQFYEWKRVMEKDTTCVYTQNSKSVTDNGKRTTLRFVCHRSGYYRNYGKGERKVKYKGSNKINGYCPSELSVVVENGSCLVHYIKTHIGHSNEIQRITLTREERDALAAKIASGMPFNKILQEVKSSNNGTSVDRLQLVTRKDLFNIAKRYSLLDSAVLHDHRDVDTWVQDTEGVIFYKPQNKLLPEFPNLREGDFILIIMNMYQREIFTEACNSLVCIDSLTGANENFDLITLMVRDSALSGFPCAFMLSNRIDQTTLELFFSCVKEKVRDVNVKALMTDMNDLYYNAWVKIFGAPRRRLYCSWNVDKAWRVPLNRVKPTEERRLAYSLLKNIQTETNEDNFKKLLHQFLNNNDIDPDLRTFLAENFVSRSTLWASCYRIDDAINEDGQLQQLHEHLKFICTYGKKQKPLDRVLNAVVKMVGDNYVSRKVILNSNDTVYHLNLIQKRHRDSYLGSLDSVITVDEGWHVSSFVELNEPYELFFVQQVVKKCNCNYVCSECHACIHQFACSCIDNSVENNMCKHIHLVIRFRDGKKHFILDEGNGTFKDIESENDQDDDRVEYASGTSPLRLNSNHQFANHSNCEEKTKMDVASIHHLTQDQPKLIIDTNDLQISLVPVLTEEEKLQRRKRQLIEAVIQRIEQVESFQQIYVLESIFRQVDVKVEEV